jgi:hypothetical protein
MPASKNIKIQKKIFRLVYIGAGFTIMPALLKFSVLGLRWVGGWYTPHPHPLPMLCSLGRLNKKGKISLPKMAGQCAL